MSAGRHLATALDGRDRSAADAVFAACAKHDTGRVRAVRAPALTESAAAVGLRRVESYWVVVTTDERPRLHHVVLAPAALRDLLDAGSVTATPERPLELTCGGRPDVVGAPGALDVLRARRCGGCCASVGYPAGRGSPDADEACGDRLDERLSGIR